MIYWLNGAYGVGKTTVALRLAALLPRAHLFDPELTGNAIRDNYPESLFRETFEQYPLWLELNCKLLRDLAARYDGDVIVPMTLLREESYAAMLQPLIADGIPVRYIFLDADADTLLQRMVGTGREEPDGWCVRQIPVCLRVQAEERHAIHINTVGRTPDEIATQIAALT